MSRQNRLNAGAEYLLCRIWATLLERTDERRTPRHKHCSHSESLLACLGALAGYASRAYGPPLARYASQAHGRKADAPNLLLTGGPLSLWALVARAVQKCGGAPPDLDEIARHVSQSPAHAFPIPGVPAAHQPRHPPLVYLKRLWPQILPIAQPFCRRPAQLPVLFGIALQRAIEHTSDVLKPSLGARIALESARATSEVVLPDAPVARLPAALPSATIARPLRRERKTRVRPAIENTFHTGLLAERLAPARNIFTIMSLAIVAMAGTMWSTEMWSTDKKEAPQVAREERPLQNPTYRPDDYSQAFETPPDEAFPIQKVQVAVARNDSPLPEELEAPVPVPEQPTNEGIIAEDYQTPFESSSGGSTEMLSSSLAVES